VVVFVVVVVVVIVVVVVVIVVEVVDFFLFLSLYWGIVMGKSGNLRDRDHFEDLGVDVSTILEWILRKSVGKSWTGLI